MERLGICRKITDLGRYGQRTLDYFVTAEGEVDGYPSYGVGIAVCENGEETMVRGITTKEDEARSLADILATNYVTPVSLGDVVYDWLCR